MQRISAPPPFSSFSCLFVCLFCFDFADCVVMFVYVELRLSEGGSEVGGMEGVNCHCCCCYRCSRSGFSIDPQKYISTAAAPLLHTHTHTPHSTSPCVLNFSSPLPPSLLVTPWFLLFVIVVVVLLFCFWTLAQPSLDPPPQPLSSCLLLLYEVPRRMHAYFNQCKCPQTRQ